MPSLNGAEKEWNPGGRPIKRGLEAASLVHVFGTGLGPRVGRDPKVGGAVWDEGELGGGATFRVARDRRSLRLVGSLLRHVPGRQRPGGDLDGTRVLVAEGELGVGLADLGEGWRLADVEDPVPGRVGGEVDVGVVEGRLKR